MILAFKEITGRITDLGVLLLWANLIGATAAMVINVWSYVYHGFAPYRFLKLFRAGIAGAYIGIFAYRITIRVVVGHSQYFGLGTALAMWVCVFIIPSWLPPPRSGTRLVVDAIERIKREDDEG